MAKSDDLKNWTERSWKKLDAQCGLAISTKEYEKLKELLREDWDDCTAHRILTGYYLANLYNSCGAKLEIAQKEYTIHLLWLIEHYPDIEDLQFCQTIVNIDSQKIEDCWKKVLQRNPDNSDIHRNADAFFQMISK